MDVTDVLFLSIQWRSMRTKTNIDFNIFFYAQQKEETVLRVNDDNFSIFFMNYPFKFLCAF